MEKIIKFAVYEISNYQDESTLQQKTFKSMPKLWSSAIGRNYFLIKHFLDYLNININNSMKKLITVIVFISIWLCGRSDNEYIPLSGQTIKDHYRRSSLCLLLLTHSDKQYADAMTEVFQSFPMPHRYNEHNVDVRVVKVKGKQTRSDIERILHRHDVARSIVAKWFNRNYAGHMNMDLIHDRGGYGAFHDDYTRSLNTVRGTDLLREEGIELLESTFVLVCDMDYADQRKGFKFGSFLVGLGSVAMQTMAAIEESNAIEAYNRGDYSKARKKATSSSLWSAGASVAGVTSAALGDMSKFRVNIHSYLYKLNWTTQMSDKVFNEYWIDASTPIEIAKARRNAFDNASFHLDYVGDYKAVSGKTILRSWSNENEVILDVCERAVGKGIKDLARRYEVFRPRTPFYIENDMVYSHIGTKEDVTIGKKYEVVRRVRDKKGRVSYKKLGEVMAVLPWNNVNIRFDNYFDNGHKGSLFRVMKGNVNQFAVTPGLQIREK